MNSQSATAERLAPGSPLKMTSTFHILSRLDHDFRTPIHGILGMADLIREGGSLDKQDLKLLSQLRKSAFDLLAVATDVLDLARVEAADLRLESIGFDLRYLVDDVLAHLAGQAHEKNIKVTKRCFPLSASKRLGDPTRFRHVLIRLIEAMMSHLEGGEILFELRGSQARQDAISVQLTASGADLASCPAARFLLDGSLPPEMPAIDRLRLTLAVRIVQAMSGIIEVQRHGPDTFGVRLVFDFPAASPQCAEGQESVGHCRLLVVDPDPERARRLIRRFEGRDLQAGTASSANAAIFQARSAERAGRPFEIIVMDRELGDEACVELAKQLLGEEPRPRRSLILLTPYGFQGDGSLFSEAGFDAYLPRSVCASELVKTAGILQSRRGSARGAPLITRHFLAEFSRHLRVLVADDNAVNQLIVQRHLEKFNCRVDLADNGREALQAVKDLPYDLVLMDCQMPVMDGYRAAVEIRRSLSRRPPIVALTADVTQSNRERCQAAGMDDFVEKPCSVTRLRGIVERWCYPGSAAQERQ